MADKKEEITNAAVTTEEKETGANVAAASEEKETEANAAVTADNKAESAKSAAPAPKKQKGAKAAEDDGLVDFYAFKDNDKYKDDIFVAINGKALKIKRGVKVRIPKAYAEVLQQSQEQDTATADLIERESEAYNNASQVIG